jgi:hypothetical protein
MHKIGNKIDVKKLNIKLVLGMALNLNEAHKLDKFKLKYPCKAINFIKKENSFLQCVSQF